MTKYTQEDIPNILNSISWQLKRIADQLDKTSNKDPLEKTTHLRQMIQDQENMLYSCNTDK